MQRESDCGESARSMSGRAEQYELSRLAQGSRSGRRGSGESSYSRHGLARGHPYPLRCLNVELSIRNRLRHPAGCA